MGQASAGQSERNSDEGELRSPGKLKHAPPMRRSLEMSKLQSRAVLGRGATGRAGFLEAVVFQVYKVFETEPDAKQINEILTKSWNEGAFELAGAPIIKSGPGEKVILILVQRW